MTDAEPIAEPIKLGEVIAGKYRVEGILGSGGMAIVLSATQLDLERLVAIKVMRAELSKVPGAVQRLLLEAKLTARFRSEHICRVLDVGTLVNGAPYVVMEYLDGVDLNALLVQRGPFDVCTAIDFILQACEGIAEAHAAGVIHRDLKPENLFVTHLSDDPPTVKVLDFGISKQLGLRAEGRVLTSPSAAVGSPHYMAPEQMTSAKNADLRIDIWALGAILYELLTGRTAFDGDTMPEVCAVVMGKDPVSASELRPEIPKSLADVIDRCLRKNPDDRFASVTELARALAPFGSLRAMTSLQRIDRVLSRGTPPAGGHATPTPVAMAVTGQRSALSAGSSAADLPTGKVNGTTSAAGALVGTVSAPRSRKRFVTVLSTLALALFAVLGIGSLIRASAQRTRAEPGVGAGSAAAPEAQRGAPPRPLLSPVAPARSAQLRSADGVDVAPLAVELAPAASLVAPATHGLKRAGQAPIPRGRPGARGSKPGALSASTPSTPPSERDARKTIEVWDPTTFGPRR